VLQGRPLYDTSADQRYFVVPQEWDRLARAIDHRNNVLISGPRGSGKTTLLRQMQHSMRSQHESVTFVDANAVGSALELAARARESVRGRPPASDVLRTGLAAAALTIGGDPTPPPGGASRALLNELESLGSAEETTILVDASGSGEAVYSLFGRMRDAIWQLPHHWVVAVDESERLSALKPPADAFFDSVLRLHPFRIEDIIELLRRRDLLDEFDERSVREIATSANGNQRAALRIANEAVVSDRNPGEAMSARARLLERAALLGRPHGMLMAELLDIGQASPSDSTLQERLGLTRSRITRILRELLDEGLVETGIDKAEGPGRPKTIYRPSPKGLA
jgi:DNA-binding MarR family transcriptional regulator/energy-coupling factor transporter ATP-binding protein EcfA2